MTAMAIPAAPSLAPHLRFTRLVRIELLKLASTRMTYGLLRSRSG